MNSRFISGWDIGGAHIKLARTQSDGTLIDVIQIPCPLWKGIDQLDQAITTLLNLLGNHHDLHAVTMTGELVDIFPNRQTGVKQILRCLNRHISADNIMVYAAHHGWQRMEQAELHWQDIASRNWQASASLITNYCRDGIFVDLGSTTCDIIAFENGQIAPQGYTDFERQRSRELLYTGTIRTPLIAISRQAPFNGQWMTLAAEVFATMGDVWCLLGKLDAALIQDNSADGQSWQAEHCARRLARMLGADADSAPQIQWQQLALWFSQQQLHHICEAILYQLSSYPAFPADAPLIGAGVGGFAIRLCAQRLNRPYLDYAECLNVNHTQASYHAPAVAMALLAKHNLP